MFGLAVWIAGLIPTTLSMAQTSQPAPVANPEKIHIKADQVIADIEGGEAEFVGNVRVTQGSSTVTADRMNVFYRDVDFKKEGTAVKQSIQKIIATGNVKINLEDMIAVTDEAVYVAKTKTLTLSGSNSKVISGENSISGFTFIMSRADGNVIVEGSTQQRVQAVLFAGEKGLF
jgi:lipopolysaccharide export system protein LptA